MWPLAEMPWRGAWWAQVCAGVCAGVCIGVCMVGAGVCIGVCRCVYRCRVGIYKSTSIPTSPGLYLDTSPLTTKKTNATAFLPEIICILHFFFPDSELESAITQLCRLGVEPPETRALGNFIWVCLKF